MRVGIEFWVPLTFKENKLQSKPLFGDVKLDVLGLEIGK